MEANIQGAGLYSGHICDSNRWWVMNGATTLSITTFSIPIIATLSIMPEFHYAECHYAECHYVNVTYKPFVLSVIIFWVSLGWMLLCWVSLGWMLLCWVLCRLLNSGLHYKHIIIINDTSIVVNEWCHNLERHSRVSKYDPRVIIFAHLLCL